MKILIYSPVFYPSIGGLEMVVLILADQFSRHGHEVKVVCTTQEMEGESKLFPFEVIRYPRPQYLLKLVKWCDVFFQANVSLKGIYPLLIHPRPFVISHNGWYTRSNGKKSWQDYLKHFATNFATNISVSQAVADHLSVASTVIPNLYQDELFYEVPEISKSKDIVFLGRLVSQKGIHLLLNALADLKQKNITPNLTIIGQGPEENNLHKLTQRFDLVNQVVFTGIQIGQQLTKTLNEHKIMVVPSISNEGFGIVALEGIACGCVVIGSNSGGIKEAIGNCGVTFPNGDTQALTQVLRNLLQNPEQLSIYRANAPEHLLRHQKSAIAKAYLEVIKTAVESSK